MSNKNVMISLLTLSLQKTSYLVMEFDLFTVIDLDEGTKECRESRVFVQKTLNNSAFNYTDMRFTSYIEIIEMDNIN